MEFQQVSPSSIDYLKLASDGEQEKWFFKLRLKYKINEQNIWFIHMCKEQQVTPKHIKLKTNNKSKAASKAVEAGERIWIKEELKKLYSKRDTLSAYLKVLHSQLTFRHSNLEFDLLYEAVHNKIRPIIHKKYLTQKSKVDQLISRKKQNNILNSNNNTYNKIKNNYTFFDRVKNLTKTQFTPEELNLLSKGFKYNIKPQINKRHLENLAVETELTLDKSNNNVGNKYLAKNIIENGNNIHETNKEINILKSIKQKSTNNQIIFTKADKGNTVIAISESDYIKKVLEFLNNNSFNKLKQNPTNLFQKQLKQAINNTEALFTNKQKYSLTIMNPQPPKLYGLIKLHKADMPIRPVVSYIKAPCRNLCKQLINRIVEHTKFKSNFAVINSQDLIRKISNLEIPHNSKLISFDVTNLFTSIPPQEVVNIIASKLEHNNCNPIIKTEILQLLEITINQNYLQFNQDYYKQTEGLAMGNPLSPILAEIYMDDLEKTISAHPLFNKCLYWHRYVDDILICFNGTDRQLKTLHNYINTIHPNIKFTIETEENKSINFLDLNISHRTNKHEFAIYHKPTHTDITIHARSFHPITHKLSAYQSMLHRLINTPMNKENFEGELNRIYTIAVNNGFSIDTINKILVKKQKAQTLALIYPKIPQNKNIKYNSITYIGATSVKIGKFIKKVTNEEISFKTNNSIQKWLRNNKDKTDKGSNSGVYMLTCEECGKVYVGQTGRTFDTRMKEHTRSYKEKKTDSTFANHCVDANHKFNNNYKTLHIQDKGKKLNLLESLEINKFNKLGLALNEQLELNNSPLLNL